MLIELNNYLSEQGLILRGGFNLNNDEFKDFSERTISARSLILIGVAGSSFWPKFEASSEYHSYLQGEANPLDRWSQRHGDKLAATFSGLAVYPFQGPPYYPFIQWAKRCETVHSSKMGFSIHPEFGLWHAFRFALLLPNSYAELDEQLQSNSFQIKTENQCDTCIDSPCLNTCPVNAYTDSGFDPDVCFNYLDQNKNSVCRTHGCIARRSCPEGVNYRYVPQHAEFHMTAFYDSQKQRIDNKGNHS